MTRFCITLDQGVEFVLRCLDAMEGGEIFVPKIPSVRIMDLVQAIAPDCKVETIGIRPGEKLHELLISQDEARSAVDVGDLYIVKPLFIDWSGKAWRVQPLPDEFAYASNTNDRWLTVEQIRGLIEVRGPAAGIARVS
jgi:UDP-N-acetylglucosamine 4,6-dehydratase